MHTFRVVVSVVAVVPVTVVSVKVVSVFDVVGSVTVVPVPVVPVPVVLVTVLLDVESPGHHVLSSSSAEDFPPSMQRFLPELHPHPACSSQKRAHG